MKYTIMKRMYLIPIMRSIVDEQFGVIVHQVIPFLVLPLFADSAELIDSGRSSRPAETLGTVRKKRRNSNLRDDTLEPEYNTCLLVILHVRKCTCACAILTCFWIYLWSVMWSVRPYVECEAICRVLGHIFRR